MWSVNSISLGCCVALWITHILKIILKIFTNIAYSRWDRNRKRKVPCTRILVDLTIKTFSDSRIFYSKIWLVSGNFALFLFHFLLSVHFISHKVSLWSIYVRPFFFFFQYNFIEHAHVQLDNRTSLFSKPNWRFQLACVVLSNIFRTMTSPLEFKINTGAFKLSAWLSRNIFHITIIQQNIGILSRECKFYLLRHLSIKCFNTSNSRFCVRRVIHRRAFSKEGLSRINLSRTFFFQLFTV